MGCSEVLSSSLQEIIVPDNHGKQKSASKQEEGDVCRSGHSLPAGQRDWKLQPQGILVAYWAFFRCPWRFSRRATLPSLLVAWLLCSRLCRGPAQHFAQTVNVLEFPFASSHTLPSAQASHLSSQPVARHRQSWPKVPLLPVLHRAPSCWVIGGFVMVAQRPPLCPGLP